MSVGATWVSPDPAAVLAVLAAHGIEPADGDARPGLVVATGSDERLSLGPAADGRSPVALVPGLVAVGIATVDAGRLAAELGGSTRSGHVASASAEPALAGRAARADAWLGARSWWSAAALSVPIVLLEPATEGRLAGVLARVGEGPLVAWIRGPTGSRQAAPPGTIRETALGPGVILRTGGRWGPFLVALVGPTGPGERGATIAP